MTWHVPLPLRLIPTDQAHRRPPPSGATWLPLPPHPGAFGVRRRHHTHEGVDLYAPAGTPVMPVEPGRVVVIEPFTGPKANTPWWHDTDAIFVEGDSGVVVYGELRPAPGINVGQWVTPGLILGHLTPVLREDKGRPMTMLHLELHAPGTRAAPAWETERPATVQDPTVGLRAAVAFQGAHGVG
jgi:hypothetical protein